MATRELNLRSLLRSVGWRDSDGMTGNGRLVLAGAKSLLVACRFEPPVRGTWADVVLQTPDDSSCPPLRVRVRVTRSDSFLVANKEPGFVGEITGFLTSSDETRYGDLVDWLVRGWKH